ncbi:quinolinate synthase NadA [Fictibacillus iocasae]|uniref:Quinolinate synthase n=1 Tax=Fictibacillus iocasae TaxID=2715437 RepID=A0ABW2NPV1_9BACL
MTLLLTYQNKNVLPEEYYKLTDSELRARIQSIKERLGERLYLPGHHYQRDEVIDFADDTGDSLQLAQLSASTKAEYIVFCGVHFMAETADMLSSNEQTVILPDLKAGCSMADMADIHQTERAWSKLGVLFGDSILPLTYVNSTAEIKAFCGRHGGATVTSSNAEKMLKWAFGEKERILFLPDQHLGRNTAFKMGIPLEQMAVWNPHTEKLETNEPIEHIKVILWKGHCSVHEKFTTEQIQEFREKEDKWNIIVHPECTHDVVEASDYSGSTTFIIDTLKKAQKGTKWAVGTEMNLVNRLSALFPEIEVVSLNPNMCPCLTMNRIDLPHLLWSLENVEGGTPQNVIKVDEKVSASALLALNRMLERA